MARIMRPLWFFLVVVLTACFITIALLNVNYQREPYDGVTPDDVAYPAR